MAETCKSFFTEITIDNFQSEKYGNSVNKGSHGIMQTVT